MIRWINKRSHFIWLLTLFLAASSGTYGQDDHDSTSITSAKPKHWSLTGYLKDLQAVQFYDIKEQWSLDNLIHNRLDLRWFADSVWKFHLGVRNRLLYGESASYYAQNDFWRDGSNSFFNLSWDIASGESYLLNTAIDRAALDFNKGKWQVTIGRQRINWGLNLVWNPNDIFNAYSYFDFDYEERPGTDAIRIQHYLNSTSSIELAYKPGRHKDETVAAALYRFTTGSYDFQALSGLMNGDFVLGGGWSGVLGPAGFNGELTTFIPFDDFSLSQSDLSASFGINYSFPNSLYLHGAYLYNSDPLNYPDSLTGKYVFNTVSAKSLAPSPHSIFAECAYQFSPLIRGDLSGIVNPADGSFYLGPFVTFSLTNTLELLTAGQLFFGKQNSVYGGYGYAFFLRLKWSF